MKIYLYKGLFRSFLLLAIILLLAPCPQIAAEENDEDMTGEALLILEEIQDILDTTIITASRTGTTLGKSTRSIGLVTRRDMKESQNYSVPKLVDNVPGVILRQEGGPGQLNHILVRGVSDDYTQLQYNGIPLKDPSDYLGSLYYSYTNFYSGLNIENIEVLKGVNSTLYGSQAVGGVINIAPEKWGSGFRCEDRTEIGEHRTLVKQNYLSYGNDDYFANISLHLMDTHGDDNGGENDFYYKNKGFYANAGKRLNEDISLEFHSIYYDAEAPMSEWTGLDENNDMKPAFASDTDFRDYKFSQNGIVFRHNISSAWNYILKTAYTQSRVQHDYDYSVIEDSGETTYSELQNNFYPTEWLTLAIGADYEKSRKSSENKSGTFQNKKDYNMETWDMFVLAKTAFFDESLFIDAGVRYSDPDDFDAEEAWEFSAAYILYKTGTKFHGHVGTGFRMPSFNEAYQWDNTFNSDLGPEKALSMDAGIDQSFFKNRLKLGAGWYKIRSEDVISNYENSGEKRSEGFEGYINIAPCKFFRLDAAYTYTETEKKYGESEWQKNTYMNLPRNKVNVTASFYPTDRLTAQFRMLWMDRVDIPVWKVDGTEWIESEWAEEDTAVVDMAVTYRLNDNTEIWARAENLFDEDYTSMTYAMPGRWLYGGVKFTF